MEEIIKFDEWMFKMQNKYYFDHERMSNAYTKIIKKNNNE
jgi:hypothetical protein